MIDWNRFEVYSVVDRRTGEVFHVDTFPEHDQTQAIQYDFAKSQAILASWLDRKFRGIGDRVGGFNPDAGFMIAAIAPSMILEVKYGGKDVPREVSCRDAPGV